MSIPSPIKDTFRGILRIIYILTPLTHCKHTKSIPNISVAGDTTPTRPRGRTHLYYTLHTLHHALTPLSKYNTVRYRTVRPRNDITLPYGTVPSRTVRYPTAPYDSHSTVPHGTVSVSVPTVHCGTISFCTIPCHLNSANKTRTKLKPHIILVLYLAKGQPVHYNSQ